MSIVQSNSSTFGKENYVIGIVKNKSNKTWEYIQIAVESYDNKNNLIGVEASSTFFNAVFYQSLRPQETSPFKIILGVNQSNLDHYIVRFSAAEPTNYQLVLYSIFQTNYMPKLRLVRLE